MDIRALGYVGVGAEALDDWSAFATGFIGMQAVDQGGPMRAFRMDDRKQRLIVSRDADHGLSFMGWEVADAAALDRVAARVEAAEINVRRGEAAFCAMRGVDEAIVFDDPLGNRLEVFHGLARADTPFTPGRPISGFVTGPLGMGHVVLQVRDAATVVPFYRDVLGFGVSDFGLKPHALYFFHVNARHHSFAMIETGRNGFHHLMVELGRLDDVGQAYDLALEAEDRIAYTLGRHTNDHMTSFYSRTPSDFFVETGWGAREIEPETWTPHETFDGPSFWGHDRIAMPPERRAQFRDMRMDAARRGVRAPSDPNCMWLDSALRLNAGR